jgi:hypothetical protein
MLVIDAFSGDSIPVHLLTKEAFSIYFRRLEDNGVLAVHVTNSYLDIQSVVERAAAYFGKDALVIESPGNPGEGTREATWVLIANRGVLDKLRDKASPSAASASVRGATSSAGLWTDDYSNLLGALR